MASLTITVPDAVVPRILNAFGTYDANGNLVPATSATMLAFIKTQIQQRVAAYESSKQAQTTQNSVLAETW